MNMAVSMARRAVKGRGKTLGAWAARLLTLGLAGYGLYEFVRPQAVDGSVDDAGICVF